MAFPIAVQLYTLRQEMERDWLRTLRAVAAMGYEGVEFAGFGWRYADEIKQALDDLGLEVVGAHLDLDRLETDFAYHLEYQQTLGNRTLIVSQSTGYATMVAWRAFADRLIRLGDRCRQFGMQLCYHNHAHELAPVDGTPGLELLGNFLDNSAVGLELDVFWLKQAGADPAGFISKFAGNVPLLHVKDMGRDGAFTEVGNGILPWPAIFAAAEYAGTRWCVVEQDDCQRPPLESVAVSLDHLRHMGLAVTV